MREQYQDRMFSFAAFVPRASGLGGGRPWPRHGQLLSSSTAIGMEQTRAFVMKVHARVIKYFRLIGEQTIGERKGVSDGEEEIPIASRQLDG